NGYDKPEIINSLENDIDIYLPDLKYMDNKIAKEYSQADNYVEFATKAIKEMFNQKGAEITLDANGYITNGLIIRHLVLPGHIENSKQVLRFIAKELSNDIHISLMSQYYPTEKVKNHPKLGRTLFYEEYKEVLDEFYNLGFHRGFIQELESHKSYRPDFNKENPFDGTNNNR
ncbi:MAG: radical SAM protein, partial [candidate division Zixibacteria bacterium]|nr:radical SAM protein [candidate division Zixibacteria bacterium]